MSRFLSLSPALFEDVLRGYVEYDENDQPTEPRDITLPDVRLDPWRLDLEALTRALVGLDLCDAADAARRVSELSEHKGILELEIGAAVLKHLGLATAVRGRRRIPVDVAQAVSRYKKWLEVAARATHGCRLWRRLGLVRTARAAWDRLTTGDGDTLTVQAVTVTRQPDGEFDVTPLPDSPATIVPIGTLVQHEREMFERVFGAYGHGWLKDWPRLPQVDILTLTLTAWDINRSVARLRSALAPHRDTINDEVKAIRARRRARLADVKAAYELAKRADKPTE